MNAAEVHAALCCKMGFATALFILWALLLVGGECLLLAHAKRNLARMTEANHHIRTSEEGDRWEEYDEHQARLAAAQRPSSPLCISLTRAHTASLALALSLRLTRARAAPP